MKTVIVERYATLGGVCLNVGCIPSKALLHVAAVMDEPSTCAGITFAKPSVDVDALRAHKGKGRRQAHRRSRRHGQGRKVEIVRGYGSFLDPHHIEVELTDGKAQDKTGGKEEISSRTASSPPGSPR